MLSLLDYVEKYCLSRSLTREYQNTLRSRMKDLERFCGRPVPLSPLDYDALNRWLSAVAAHRAPHTARGYRLCLLALLNGAADDGYTDYYPQARRIKRIRIPQLVPVGWTTDQVRLLLIACQHVKGKIDGIVGADWWESLIRAGYDTGLRKSDLMRLTPYHVRLRSIPVVQQKTGRLHLTGLHPSTVKRIDATFPPERNLVWPWPWRREKFFSDFKLIVARAGLFGTFKYLRRSSGSYVEQQHGCGARHLGHADGSVFPRHYEITSITRASVPLPPEL